MLKPSFAMVKVQPCRETGSPWAEIDTTQNDYEEIGAFIIDHKQNIS